jgi:hypothetical protein
MSRQTSQCFVKCTYFIFQAFQFQTPDELSHVYHTEMSKNPANAVS